MKKLWKVLKHLVRFIIKITYMILVPISTGELIDKLSILHVKKKKITNIEKLKIVEKEIDLIYPLTINFIEKMEINSLYSKLIEVNSQLWEYKDRIRILDSLSIFEGEFIFISKKIYTTNDYRFKLKNEINILTNSELKEVKDY